MIIRNKIELAVFYQSGDDPFICGINGMIDTISLNEIEMDLVGDAWDFEDGSGTYFFEAGRVLEQVGDGGRIEIGAHWELAQMWMEPSVLSAARQTADALGMDADAVAEL